MGINFNYTTRKFKMSEFMRHRVLIKEREARSKIYIVKQISCTTRSIGL